MLSSEELKRYSRHTILKEFGVKGQEKLKAGKVLVVGAGGLGCPALQYLNAAGVGTIGIVDYDIVDVSNLQRQILFNNEDIGMPKAVIAAKKLKVQNPNTKVIVFNIKLESKNALEIISEFDVVIDGSDNFPTRYLVNDACVILNKPFVFGSIYKLEAQVSVFNYNNGPTYRCLYPTPPNPKEAPKCSEIGVLGVVPGTIGCLQANETIKILTGVGTPLSGKLLVLNMLCMETTLLELTLNNDNCQITELADYDNFCQTNSDKGNREIMQITVQELKTKLDQKEDIQIIDVREKHEFQICNIEGDLIPLGEIPDSLNKISKEKMVVIHCHHGIRSANAILHIRESAGHTNLYNLKGGINAWATEIDPEMSTY